MGDNLESGNREIGAHGNSTAGTLVQSSVVLGSWGAEIRFNVWWSWVHAVVRIENFGGGWRKLATCSLCTFMVVNEVLHMKWQLHLVKDQFILCVLSERSVHSLCKLASLQWTFSECTDDGEYR